MVIFIRLFKGPDGTEEGQPIPEISGAKAKKDAYRREFQSNSDSMIHTSENFKDLPNDTI